MKNLQWYLDTAAFHIRKSIAGAVLAGVVIVAFAAGRYTSPSPPAATWQVAPVDNGLTHIVNIQTGEVYFAVLNRQIGYLGNLNDPSLKTKPSSNNR